MVLDSEHVTPHDLFSFYERDSLSIPGSTVVFSLAHARS